MTKLNTADAVYFGTHKADKVYLGSNLVWQPPLPFPSTPILDTFNRADENPLNPAHWSTPINWDSNGWKIVNKQGRPAVTGWSSTSWLQAYPTPFEAYITVASWQALKAGIYLWAVDDSTFANALTNSDWYPGGYLVAFDAANSNWFAYPVDIDDGWSSDDIIARSVNHMWTDVQDGDTVGMRIDIHGVISVWQKHAGGSFVMLGSGVDTKWQGPFHPAIEGNNTSGAAGPVLCTNFGGGSIP